MKHEVNDIERPFEGAFFVGNGYLRSRYIYKMTRTLILALFAAATLLFSSCGGNSAKSQDSVTANSDTNVADSAYQYNLSQTALATDFCDTVYHRFSSADSDDRFTFYIPKGKITETKAILTIQNAQGILLFSDTFETRALIHYDADGVKTESEIVAYIPSNAKDVLGTSSFHMLKENDELFSSDTAGYPDRYIMYECKQENRPLFFLSLWEEDNTYYGYSRKMQKFAPVYGCC